MKKLFTLIALLLGATAMMAVPYHPFPTSNTIWTERHGNGDTTPSFYCYALLNQDTTLGMNTYHVLFKSGDTIFTASERVGGLREDSMMRVYYYSFASGSEKLLYDFSVQPGDTIYDNQSPAGIVDYTDSIDINGNYHRRIAFKTLDGTNWLYGSWIEGVGNAAVGGLLGATMLQPTCDCATNTICLRENNVWTYHNPIYAPGDCLAGVLSVAVVHTSGPAVTFYPNPVRGTGHLHIDGVSSGNTVRIYNITGTMLHSYNAVDDITISKEQYPAGIYIYRISDALGNTSFGKFTVE